MAFLRSACRLHQSFCRHRSWSLLTTSRAWNSSVVGGGASVDNGNQGNNIHKVVPANARVVICGGGVIGSSVAYHLALRGWNDVVVLEQGRLTCGTTWHSAGLIGQAKDDINASKLIRYSKQLYEELEESHGIGWKKCGSLMLAKTKDRMIYLKRKQAIATATGVESHLVTQKEIEQLQPLVRVNDLEGGLWIPEDGVVTAPDLVSAYVSVAKSHGVKVIEGVEVNRINTKNRFVDSVETSHGTIKCEYFVNCGGQWARQIGKKSNPRVRVPLHSVEHFYLVTTPMEGVHSMLPVTRDYDGLNYTREWSGGLLAGGFEPVGKPCFHTKIPDKFEFQLLPEDWDHFQVLLDPILHRYPALHDAQVRQLVNGPESFTPDQNWNLGESPEVGNYYIAAGMNSMGVVGSGGIGKHLAEWMVDGEPSINLAAHDILRFVQHHNNRHFLKERVKETIGLYALHYPYSQWQTGRRLRCSALYTQLANLGACFGETNAYERPIYFRNIDDEEYHDDTSLTEGTYGRPHWLDYVKEEYWACKERVAIVDMSSFAKLEVTSKGNEALEFLQYLSSNDIAQGTGEIIHTGMQNNLGGYENDCTIVPFDDNLFFIISPASQQTRSLTWLSKHLPEDGSVTVRDVTSAYSGISLVGPHAQSLLDDVTDISVTLKDFKPMTCKTIDVGFASGVRAMRLTHTGEDGFVLYVPAEYSLHLYETLMKAGQDYGIRNAGYYAIRKLRIEKFFAFWGLDLTTHTTPLECGRDFRVKFNKGDFIGKDALLKQKQQGISQRFVQFFLKDFDQNEDVWPTGGEPIYRNGKYVGSTTSSGFGFKLNSMICLGFVRDYDSAGNRVIRKDMKDWILNKNAKYEIDVGGKMFKAEANLYTPKAAYSAHEPVFIPTPVVKK